MILTEHVQKRMSARRIDEEAIRLVVSFGRKFYAREAVIYVVGRKEIDAYEGLVDLEGLEGVHVVTSQDGVIITTYRNRSFRKADFRKPRWHRAHRTTSGPIWLRNVQRLGL